MTDYSKPKKPSMIVLGKNKTKVTMNGPRRDIHKEAIVEQIKRIVLEKADRIGQAYTKSDYDKCYSAPRFVLADPDAPSSLKDLAYRVTIVSTEDYDENEDAILTEKVNRGNNFRVKGATSQEVELHKSDVAAGKKWVTDNPVVDHRHIVEHYNAATANEKKFGHTWYNDAHHLTKHIANDTKTPMHTAAGLVGNYSPQNDWATNIMTAARVARTKVAEGGKGSGIFASAKQKEAAHRMLHGEHHEGVLKGHKIRAFTHLIEHGGDRDSANPHAVVDRHAAAVAHGARITDNAYKHGLGGLKSKNLYHSYEQHYHNAAKEITANNMKPGGSGETVHAHQVQAVTWLVRQRRNQAEEQGKSKTGKSATSSRVKKSGEMLHTYLKQHHPKVAASTDINKMSGYS